MSKPQCIGTHQARNTTCLTCDHAPECIARSKSVKIVNKPSCFGAYDDAPPCGFCNQMEECKSLSMPKEKATRHNSGKPKVSLVLEAREALLGAAVAMEIGVNNHGRKNYMAGEGLKHTEVADSLLRHLTAWLSGEDNDPETGVPHVDFILTNGLFLSQLQKTRPDGDDRIK